MKKNKAAYSLIEVLVSVSILAILVVMMLNTVLLSFKVVLVAAYRSKSVEVVNDLNSLISYDIRNSANLIECDDNSVSCIVLLNGKRYVWKLCQDLICKYEILPDSSESIITVSNSNFRYSGLSFQNYTDNSGIESVYVTYRLQSRLPGVDVNSINQFKVSLRNYRV
ncbi:prepilin-type N-terminal cleavage/methylation domain-containing protein [Candidatus Dojkabacteria bacterium]|uniref:Prepilin-type N-terminal cleavage/methylation domain-containing protein n=1 Tax=Candidatus Dojkabacteria bacterium TaxID=2099670 RepID=A0A3M0Z3Y9_9BACT|nr:MAG: prepilin-type N-terminal cleavage/methylation domain-containing protein [Candidatus Dojkabacteria bacterium]